MVKIMEHPIKMDDFGDTTIFGNFHIIHLVELRGLIANRLRLRCIFFTDPSRNVGRVNKNTVGARLEDHPRTCKWPRITPI